jgi:hypothetical protein
MALACCSHVARLPCRIILNIEGAEVFCFNRTPAYDAIVDRMKKREAKQREERDGKLSPQESATSTSRAPGSPSSRLRRRQQSPPGDSEYSSKPEVQGRR